MGTKPTLAGVARPFTLAQTSESEADKVVVSMMML
jgi:hypothetical protein